MSSTYEIPLSGEPERFSIQLGDVTYQLTVTFRDATMGGWLLDIADADGNAMVNGIPLVTGADLLEPFSYLGFGGELFVQTDADADEVPTFTDLGAVSHLYFKVT